MKRQGQSDPSREVQEPCSENAKPTLGAAGKEESTVNLGGGVGKDAKTAMLQ